ncbi:hypothetical protein SO802_000389 [Lithocarpus litseifolius]|uniref:Reverse transcriptase zinc-binding domain-containing protein n=1 Tax=Lithocarpus litseifolius TaxID=425828 RepID=A0AAW2DRG1_9ROSI
MCRCLGSDESVIHAIWSCPAIDCVWEEAARWGFRDSVIFQSCSELVAWILEHGKHPELFSMIAWSIWTQRNQIRTVQQHCTTDQLAQIAKARLEEYQAIRSVATNIAPLQSPSQRQTCNGQVVASLSEQLNQAYQPIEVKAMAAIRRISLRLSLALWLTAVEKTEGARLRGLEILFTASAQTTVV